MPVRRSADLCGSCHARRPDDGWPRSADGDGVGAKTRDLLQEALSDDFSVLELQDVSPLRWVYRATRGPDGAAPLSIYVLFAPVDESRTSVWLQPTLSARIGCKASHMQQVLATGRLDEDRVYAVVTPAPASSLADNLATGSLPLRRALRIGADVCAAWGRLQELGQALGPVPASRICLEPRWNGSDDLRILSTWFLGEEGQEWEAVDGVVPPEWRPGQDTPASDAFSVGALIYRAICQHLPYSAPARREAQRCGEPPEWVGVRIPESEGPVPPGLDNLLREMLHYDPATRPTDARRLHGVLLAMLESSTAPTVSPVMLLSDLTDVPAITRSAAPPVRPPPSRLPRKDSSTADTAPPKATPAPLLHSSPLAFSPPRSPTPVSVGTHTGLSRRTVAPATAEPAAANSVTWFGVAFAGTGLLAVMVALIVWLALPLPGRLTSVGALGGHDPLEPVEISHGHRPSVAPARRPPPDLADAWQPMSMADAGPRSVVVKELVPEPEAAPPSRRRRLMRNRTTPEAVGQSEPEAELRPSRISPEPEPVRTIVVDLSPGVDHQIDDSPPIPVVLPQTAPSKPTRVVVPPPAEEPEPTPAPVSDSGSADPIESPAPAPRSRPAERPSAADGTDLKNPFAR